MTRRDPNACVCGAPLLDVAYAPLEEWARLSEEGALRCWVPECIIVLFRPDPEGLTSAYYAARTPDARGLVREPDVPGLRCPGCKYLGLNRLHPNKKPGGRVCSRGPACRAILLEAQRG